MSHKWSSKTAFCVLAAALAGPLYAQAAKPSANDPCAQVESACKSAGFHNGGSKEGKGLWSDCIDPLMKGHPVIGGKPLPGVDDKVVAACRAKDPTFGQPTKAKTKPKE
jgi:hypothetical protein